MIDNLKSQEELEVKKLKVTKADIVVKGNVDKPYYVIVYHEVGKDYDNEGFGSYYLENVFKWRNEELEIVDEKEQPKTDWIPCEEDMPMIDEYALVQDDEERIFIACIDSLDGEWRTNSHHVLRRGSVIAWQPLPTPYKKEGTENG